MVLAIAVTPLYFEYLGAESFGLVGFFMLVQSWSSLMDLGLSPTLGRQVSYVRGSGLEFHSLLRLLRSFELIFVFLAMLSGIAFLLSNNWIASNWIASDSLSIDVISYSLALMALMLGLRWFSSLYRSGIEGFEDQVWLNKVIVLLSDGSQFGINLSFATQEKPNGLAEAFLIGEGFIGSDNACLVLGDNIFYGASFRPKLEKASLTEKGGVVFGYRVKNPADFGIAELDGTGNVLAIQEKPEQPKSNLAVTGLYFYGNDVIDIAKNITPSSRGELEITDINSEYINRGLLRIEELGRGFAWLDTGTPESLLQAGHFVETIESRQGFKIACLEEIAYNHQWISDDQLLKLASECKSSSYRHYLKSLTQQDRDG